MTVSIEKTVAAGNLSFIPTNLAESYVQPSVIAEVAELQALGHDVQLVNTHDQYALSPVRQQMIDEKVAELEAMPAGVGAEAFRTLPAMAHWAPLTKRAIALHTLYNPLATTLAEGVDPTIYDAPLFGGASAKDVLRAVYKDDAAAWIDAYDEFTATTIDDGTDTAIGSRDFYQGVRDAEGVRTRATAAMDMVTDHIANSPVLQNRQDLVSASLACGAAGPVYQMVKNLEAQGHKFDKVILVDQDPMALATAASIAENDGISEKVSVELKDLVRENMTDYISAHSVDIVDMLGLFEYFKPRLATEVLRRAAEVVRPGGMIVFGNILNERPQQTFFSDVVEWPPLQQRTITEVLDIITEAGFPLEQVTARVPQTGVYAVYGIRIPETVDVSEGLIADSVEEHLGLTAVERY